MAQKKEIAAVIVIAAVLGAIILCCSPLSHSWLHKKITGVIRWRTGSDSCSAGKVSLILFRGVVIHDLACSKSVSAQTRLQARFPVVAIDWDLLAVFRNWPAIQAAAKTAVPAVTEREAQNGWPLLRAIHSALFTEDTLVSACVRRITVEKGSVAVDSFGVTVAGIEGFEAVVHRVKEEAVALKLRCRADTITARRFGLRDVKTALHIQGDRYVVTKFSADLYGGALEAEGECDVYDSRINSAQITLKKAHLDHVWPAMMTRGKVSLELNVDTSGVDLASWRATGKATLSGVTVDSVGIVSDIARILEIHGQLTLKFKKITAGFMYRDGTLLIDGLDGKGDPLSLTASGTLKPESGLFHFDVTGIFEADFISKVAPVTWNSLTPLEDGRRSFACSVSGTPDNPSVSLDRELMLRAVENIFEEMREDMKPLFRKRK